MNKLKYSQVFCLIGLIIIVSYAQKPESQLRLYDDPRIIAWAKGFIDGNREQVLNDAEQDLRSDSPHPFASHAWTVIQFSLGRLEEGWEKRIDGRLQKALGSLPEIYRLYQRGEYKRLLKEYPPSEASAMTDVWALDRLALAAQEQDRGEDALTYELTAVRLQPDNFQAAWIIAANLMPNERVRAKIEELLKSGEWLTKTPIGQYLLNKLHYLTTNAKEDDLSAIDAWLKIYPRDARALRCKGLILTSLTHYEQALEVLAESTAIYPFKTVEFPNWKERAVNLMRISRFSQARDIVIQSATLDSKDEAESIPLAEQRLASALLSAGAKDEARKVLDAANRRWPRHVGLLIERADFELQTDLARSVAFSHEEVAAGIKPEKLSPALSFARKAAQSVPQKLEAQLLLMRALLRAGSRQASMPSPALNADFEKIHAAQSALLQEAALMFELSEKRFDQKSKDLFWFGSELYSEMRRGEEQVKLCERAVAEYPGSAWMIKEYANALIASGRRAEALAQLRASFDIETPNEWAIAKFKALVAELNGAVNVQKELDILISRSPTNPLLIKASSPDRDASNENSQPVRPELRIQDPHKLRVMSVGFSHDSKFIVTGGGQDPGQTIDGTIKLWEVKEGRLIRTFEGHRGGVESVEFSPNDQEILSSGMDGSVKLWDGNTGRLIWSLEDQGRGPAAFSPDGQQVVTPGSKIWETKTGRLISTSIAGNPAVYHPKSNLVAASDGEEVNLWDAGTGKLIKRFGSAKSDVNMLSFSPDGRKIAAACGRYKDNQILIWDSVSGQLLRTINGHSKAVSGVAFHPDNKTLVSFSHDATVKLWDSETGRLIRTHKGHDGWGGAVAFSPDGKWLASGAEGSALNLWKVDTGELARVLHGPTTTIGKESGFIPEPFGTAFSPNGRYLASAGYQVVIWDLSNGRLMRSIEETADYIAFSPDSETIASSFLAAETVRLWKIKTGELVKEFEVKEALCLAFDSAGKRIAIGDRQASITIWDTTTGKRLNSFKNPTTGDNLSEWGNKLDRPSITSIAFSPDGKFILTGDGNKNAKLWDLTTGRPIWPREKISQNTGSFRLIPALFTENVRSSLPPKPEVEPDYSTCVAFSSDQQIVALGIGSPKGSPNPIYVMHAATGRVLEELNGHTGGVNSLAFSPDGKMLVSAGRDNTLRTWEVKTGRLINILIGHSDDVRAVGFSPDGKFMISSSGDGTMKIWVAQTSVSPRPGSTDQTQSPRRPRIAHELCTLVSFTNDAWLVVDAEGRFDTSKLEEVNGLHWVVSDDPRRPLPLEIFMRDYYEPRLLPRLLSLKDEKKLKPVRAIAGLNRVQPAVSVTGVNREANSANTVSVTVEVEQGVGTFTRDGKPLEITSGVYDLRLFRDGQFVAQSRDASIEVPKFKEISDIDTELKEWREANRISIPANAKKRTLTFHNIRLPQQPGLNQVEFTAYAFNEDRVKSLTSLPFIYKLPANRGSAKRRAYIITLGANAAQDRSWDLWFAASGARSIQQLLSEKLKRQAEFEEIVPVSLISDYENGKEIVAEDLATKDNLRAALDLLAGREVIQERREQIPNYKLLRAATPDDLVVVYIASHGYADPHGAFYIVPTDIGETVGVSETLLNRCLAEDNAKRGCEEAMDFIKHTISTEDLAQWFSGVDAGEMVLILDSCHSAAVSGREFKPGPMGDRGFGQLSYDKGMIILAATQAENVAKGTRGLNQSLITYALTHEPEGKDFGLRQWLSGMEVAVPELYQKYVPEAHGEEQKPTLFDFARRKANVAQSAPQVR
jgi:WD40 repeat protein